MVDISAFFNDLTNKPKPELLPACWDCNRDLLKNNFGKQLAEYLHLNIETGPWLAGGAVRKSYLGIEMGSSDWDIWFNNKEQFQQAELNIKRLNASLAYTSDNAVSYRFYDSAQGEQNIQLICKSFYDKPEQIISNFDFSVCQLVTDGRKLIMGEYTARDLRSKTLRLTQSELPPYIMSRLIKYVVYDYRPCKQLIDQIEDQTSNIDWTKNTTNYDTI